MYLPPLLGRIEKHRMKHVRRAFCRGRDDFALRGRVGFWCGVDCKTLQIGGNVVGVEEREVSVYGLDEMEEEKVEGEL